MSEPTSRDDAAVGPPEHLHPLFLLTGLGKSLRGMAGGYAAIGYLAVSGRLGSALVTIAILLAFMAISVFVYWQRFQFRVGENEIRIDSGILSRTHRSIPFDRIQDVDITQGPLARVLGLARVQFETGGSGGKEEGVLHSISLERAEELRALVRSRRGQASTVRDVPEASAEPVYSMGFGRLLLAGAFNFSLAIFAGLFGLTQTFGDVLGFNPFDPDFWMGLLSASDPLRDFIFAHRVAAAIAGAAVLVLVGAATGIVRTVLTDFGFRLDKTGVGLRRRRGLLTRTDVTLPISRAQAAVIASGPVKDWLRWRELRVQSLAKDESSRGSHVLAPLARDGEVSLILGEMAWAPVPRRPGWIRVSSAFVVAFAIALSPLLLVALVNFIFQPLVGVAILAGLGGFLAMRWLAWSRTAYALDGDRILVRTGWWNRRTTVLPARRIQSVDLRENFITRAFGIAWLQFGVAGGGMTGHSIPAIPRGEARKLRDLLLDMGS
ncbi:PH domain-containing protein [Sphingomonas daechungensis]|uniref:PH domain-containing protein n=1 Tax=Sphingomonas daechungensis TaxID=1176646 RepID=A0ABX6T0C8_9SPHN|nr:PH domain-containing protein [Sphingomonas daechungensis]QNP42357.1 PH domain-containing protein [Sphingomonas daechungensis]